MLASYVLSHFGLFRSVTFSVANSSVVGEVRRYRYRSTIELERDQDALATEWSTKQNATAAGKRIAVINRGAEM